MYVSAMSHCHSWFPRIPHQTPPLFAKDSSPTLVRSSWIINTEKKSLTEVFWLWRDVKAVKTIPNRSSWQTESDSFNSFSPIQKHQAPNSEQLIDNMFLSFPPSWKDQTPKSDSTSWKQNFLFICILRTSNVECKKIIRYWISLYKHLETKIYNKQYTIQLNKSQWGWRRRLCFTLHTLCWLPVWAVWNSFESIRAFEWVITLWAAGGKEPRLENRLLCRKLWEHGRKKCRGAAPSTYFNWSKWISFTGNISELSLEKYQLPDASEKGNKKTEQHHLKLSKMVYF